MQLAERQQGQLHQRQQPHRIDGVPGRRPQHRRREYPRDGSQQQADDCLLPLPGAPAGDTAARGRRAPLRARERGAGLAATSRNPSRTVDCAEFTAGSSRVIDGDALASALI